MPQSCSVVANLGGVQSGAMVRYTEGSRQPFTSHTRDDPMPRKPFSLHVNCGDPHASAARSGNSRRSFLRGAVTAGAVLGGADFAFLSNLRPVSAAELNDAQNPVRFAADVEPLVRLLEETPREQVIEVFAAKIQSGTSYQEILAALLLAGVRNVEPRPSVGFKFHAVLVVNSAHLASLASPDSDRWLPIFWALDYFKSSQARDENEGNWTMAAVDESKVPPPHRARTAFRTAMENWDVEAADVATAALARSAGANEVFDLFAHYGCRDFRSIGHKAIFVANSFRTLQVIGWRFAEPVLRSLAYALLNHSGEPNPATSDLAPDAAWRTTNQIVTKLPQNWQSGNLDRQATLDLLDSLRTATPEQAVNLTAEMLHKGIAVQSIADALFLSAGEMLMQQPGIVSLHSATSTNALHYGLRTARNRQTRQRLLLQNAAFIPYFRDSMAGRGNVGETRVNTLFDSSETVETHSKDDMLTTDQIFDSISKDKTLAAKQMRDYLAGGASGEDVIQHARRLVFLKGNDSHDYKFSSAVLEDYYAVSPGFRNAFLATSAYLLPGSGARNNDLVARVQEALT